MEETQGILNLRLPNEGASVVAYTNNNSNSNSNNSNTSKHNNSNTILGVPYHSIICPQNPVLVIKAPERLRELLA